MLYFLLLLLVMLLLETSFCIINRINSRDRVPERSSEIPAPSYPTTARVHVTVFVLFGDMFPPPPHLTCFPKPPPSKTAQHIKQRHVMSAFGTVPYQTAPASGGGFRIAPRALTWAVHRLSITLQPTFHYPLYSVALHHKVRFLRMFSL
ncbi:hypothetical protein DFJ77DRAFT_474165 [Powellomyces hirtus]|nr:hypothetical protein DFJ77DRAFT_474165 [Powellomyces hirtus]